MKRHAASPAGTTHLRDGYIFLISVLVVGVLATGTVIALVLLGLGSQRSAFTFQQSALALALANACIERGLADLRDDPGYQGLVERTFENGTCELLRTGGSGNENRTLCAEGRVGNVVRRVQVIIDRLQPSTTIFSWQETDILSACSYE